MSIFRTFALALVGLPVALASTAGCSKSEPAPAAAKAGGLSAADATALYKEQCSSCHGLAGKGDGVAASAFPVKPRNYTDAAWQASVTDDQIKKTVLYGGAAVGKSAMMPSFPIFEAQPEKLEALVGVVRSFKGK